MAQQTFPHVAFNVNDKSRGNPLAPPVVPLHLPTFFIHAEKGIENTPYYGLFADLQQQFGIQTFTETSPFFQHPTIFAKVAAQAQPIFIVRLADDSAATASLVLEAAVSQMPITQYELDSLGAPVLDNQGNKITRKQVDGITAVTEPGVSLKLQVRALSDGETYDAINPVTTTNGGVTTTTYPIIADLGTSRGSGINRDGFSLYYTPDYDVNLVNAIKSMTYRFAPVTLAAANSSTTTMVLDSFGANFNDISLKASAIDQTTAQDVSLNAILENNYTGTDSSNKPIPVLDYTMNVYSDNVATIGALIKSLSPELDANLDPFMINLLTAIDENGNPYLHFVVDAASAQVSNQNVVLYHQGGSDGVLSKASLESLTAAFCQSTSNPDFQDYFRYPMSHFYDSGYSLTTKYAMMNLFALRDDIEITFSTQDLANQPNSSAQDQSAGAAILASALLYPESTIYGTPAMRAEIFQQVGKLAAGVGVTYKGWVPCTLDRLIKRCKYYNADVVKGTPKARPNSEVTAFKSVSWTEATVTQKQTNWDTALNTISYADMSTLFYPDIRSIYPDQTSLLSDGVFVDYLIFTKHIVRLTWTFYSGSNTPIEKQYTTIANDIDGRLGRAMNGLLPSSTSVYQTALDQQNGFSVTVDVGLQGTMPNRIWSVILTVSRAAATTSST